MIYLVNALTGGFSMKFTEVFDLDLENSLPNWYSSLQLFAVAGLFAIFARCRFDRRSARAWALLALPVIFLALSIDEVAEIHEWAGLKVDELLLPRGDTPFVLTGLWMFVIGVPFLAALVSLIHSVRVFFKATPHVASKMVVGTLVLMGGAAGVETLVNFVPWKSTAHVLEVALEESLEMVGVTIILWAVVDLLHSHGFAVEIRRSADAAHNADPARPTSSFPAQARQHRASR